MVLPTSIFIYFYNLDIFGARVAYDGGLEKRSNLVAGFLHTF